MTTKQADACIYTNKNIDLLLTNVICVTLMNQIHASICEELWHVIYIYIFIQSSSLYFKRCFDEKRKKESYPFVFVVNHKEEEKKRGILHLLESRSCRYEINLSTSVCFFLYVLHATE
jgi:hypothetical protein